jgi:hypothetical protein
METNKENQVNNIKAKPTVARYILVAVSTILLWGLFYLLLVVGVFIVVEVLGLDSDSRLAVNTLGYGFIGLFLPALSVSKRHFLYKRDKKEPTVAPQKRRKLSDDRLEQLEKLAQLKDRGVLTEEEFNKEKSELLN